MLNRHDKDLHEKAVRLVRDRVAAYETERVAIKSVSGTWTLVRRPGLSTESALQHSWSLTVTPTAGDGNAARKSQADRTRMRRDLTRGCLRGEVTVDLGVLTARRAGLEDRPRAVNRLRHALASIFHALERELELTRIGPLVLLCGYPQFQTCL